jgi:galactosylceramidase
MLSIMSSLRKTILKLFPAVGLLFTTTPSAMAADGIVIDTANTGAAATTNQAAATQVVELKGDAGGRRFDGIGVVDGGGATSVLLKDYPEPQRSQILDLVYKPKFGASVSALLVEIPGDGNATQGSMPSHMHTRDDLNYSRGYTWWILREAKKRNPDLTLDGTAWAAPGWLGNGNFWSQDTADYYVKWLQGLRSVYGLEFDAIGCRNEKGVSYDFVKMLRATLDANGFDKVRIHAFDNWPANKFDFVKDMVTDEKLRDAIGILSAHTLAKIPASPEVREMAAQLNKPIWNTEEHVYLKGFDCAISIVKAFNENFIRSGATKIVNWYGIAGVYPMEPYSEDPAMLLARSPWSGHYEIREALWGYAHYGQFTQVGWQYLDGGCGDLAGGGTFVTLKSPGNDYSIIIETKGATAPQQMRFQIGGGLAGKELCVWRSNAKEQFIQQAGIMPVKGSFTITLEPDSIYSLSTTTGQQKGSFDNIPADKPFPLPYYETFDEYSNPKEYGYLPRYTADIADVFEIVDRPDKKGKCLRQVIPVRPIEWAPEYMPYTVLGDDQWRDYEVSADVYLNPGDSAGVMGRINNVGPGFRNVPKGYYLTLGDDGQCHLVLIRGLKRNPNKLEGDVEQQALIKAGKAGDDSEGGPKELGTVQLPNIRPDQWHNLKLRFEGTNITGFVDDKPVLTATDNVYGRGMAGLRAGEDKNKLCTPYFDNLLIKAINAPVPNPSQPLPAQSPMYSIPLSNLLPLKTVATTSQK